MATDRANDLHAFRSFIDQQLEQWSGRGHSLSGTATRPPGRIGASAV
jgi:hypothetical protein